MSRKTSYLKRVIQPIILLALGGAILWLLYRNIEWSKISDILQNDVNYSFLALSLVFGLLANTIRGLRWNLLVQPVIPKGEPSPRLSNAILTVLGSYTVNMVIPRSGEIWRCAEYKRYENVGFSEIFGTLINDRLTDIISLSLILCGVVFGYQDFFFGFFTENPEQLHRLNALLYSPWLYLALILAVAGMTVLYYLLKKYPNNRASLIIRSIITGVASIRAMEQRGLFLIYSLLIWIGYYFYFYTAFFAFPFTQNLGVGIALIAFALSSMSALIPVQAGMGAWHAAVIAVLVAYGVSNTDAAAFALIVHSLQTLWITLIGLVAIILLPFVNRHYQRITNKTDNNEANR